MMITAAGVFAPFVYVLVDKTLEDGVYEKVKVMNLSNYQTAGAYVWIVTVKNRAKMCDAFFDWYYSEYFDTFVDYNNSLLLPPRLSTPCATHPSCLAPLLPRQGWSTPSLCHRSPCAHCASEPSTSLRFGAPFAVWTCAL